MKTADRIKQLEDEVARLKARLLTHGDDPELDDVQEIEFEEVPTKLRPGTYLAQRPGFALGLYQAPSAEAAAKVYAQETASWRIPNRRLTVCVVDAEGKRVRIILRHVRRSGVRRDFPIPVFAVVKVTS